MAKREVLVDDLDGSEVAVTTIPFSIDGDQYEIDLSRENAKELRKVLHRYAKVARPVRKANGRSKNGEPASSALLRPKRGGKKGPSAKEVRTWARENHIDVTPTGRVPQSLIDQYLAAK